MLTLFVFESPMQLFSKGTCSKRQLRPPFVLKKERNLAILYDVIVVTRSTHDQRRLLCLIRSSTCIQTFATSLPAPTNVHLFRRNLISGVQAQEPRSSLYRDPRGSNPAFHGSSSVVKGGHGAWRQGRTILAQKQRP
jgi:hypothetical protein